MQGKRIGVAITGSFCSFSQVLPVIERLARENEVTTILSAAAATMDTRFYRAEDFRRELQRITGRPPMTTIAEAEQVGPMRLFDVILVAPCTGNTLAKLHHGITDTAVLMAIKAQVRNDRPVVLALSTNDALGTSAVNIGGLLNRRNLYFVPFSQDDHDKKPRSMAARFGLCEQTMEAALEGRQAQPLIL